MPPGADIASSLEDISRRLRAAAARSGRNSDDILLVAVSKTVPPDVVRAAAAAGQRHFGLMDDDMTLHMDVPSIM